MKDGACVCWLRQIIIVLVSLCACVVAGGIGLAGNISATEGTGPQMTIAMGHTKAVISATFSPDGHLVLTGSEDGTACLWDTTTGRELRRFEGKGQAVTSATFSPDGHWVLTARSFGTATLWDTASGRKLRDFEGPGFYKNSAVFSPDGLSVLTGTTGIVHLWEAATGRELQRFVGSFGFVDTLGFSPDGRSILTLSGGIVHLWDVATGSELRSMGSSHERHERHNPKHLTSAVFSPDGHWILTTSEAGSLALWDTTTGRELPSLPRSRNSSFAIFSPDGYSVLSFDHGSSGSLWAVVLWDAATGREMQRFEGHISAPTSVAISPDGRIILTADYLVTRLWDASTGHELRRLDSSLGRPKSADPFAHISNSSGHLKSALFSPDGYRILITAKDGTVALWDTTTGRELRRPYVLRARPSNFATFSPDGHSVLIAGRDRLSATLWDAATGHFLRRFEGHIAEAQSAAISPDGRRVLTTSDGGLATLWDTTTGRERHRFQDGKGKITSAAFSPDGHRILTASDGRFATLWDPTTGRELHRFQSEKGKITSATFSPDGHRILTASDDGRFASLWDAATGHALTHFEGFKLKFFSPDGRILLTGTLAGMQLWDAVTGRELRPLEGSSGFLNSAAFSPDSHQILTADRESGATLWDAATGREVRRFEGQAGEVESTAFAPNGRWALTISQDQLVRLWDVHTGEELARLTSSSDGTWVVSTPDGRFDSNDLEQVRGFYWTMPDDPFRSLPFEIFMRDYYEPRLLPRVLSGEKSPSLPSLADLNRAQPKVEIKDVHVDDAEAGRVAVIVEVANDTVEVTREGKPVVMQSGAFDLRLSRNGQLVGQYPDLETKQTFGAPTREQELEQWRQHHEIKLDPKTGKKTVTFHGIRLPRKAAGLREVKFSAYAFNSDRVKSATALHTLSAPKELNPRQGRAYLVTIGVNGFEGNAMTRLSYAANDAHMLSAELSTRLKAVKDPGTGQLVFGEINVVPITLVTQFGTDEKAGELMINHATKAHIKTVIDTLAGKPVDPTRLEEIPNAEHLLPAQPEDLVVIAFSTHGDTDQRGEFYLMPYDLGLSSDMTAIRQHAISSEELSEWLRPLDAGEMIMIVDACHSAATVEGQGFKPGPMGSRGLGQLAFDKGMRILAASQRDQYALETEKTQQGLLSYALVREGLIGMAADFRPKDARIQFSEWLSYGAERVPELYRDYREGKLKARAATPLDEPEGRFISMQQPALFDFARGRDLLLVGGLGQ